MKTAEVVIGAMFGDEGKGNMVSYLASKKKNPAIVRFNGGAQAGHTVQSVSGKRHVFHHFGSSFQRNVTTILSDYFIANPFVFADEREELIALGVKPQIWIDENCQVTTPYDMIVNQMVEAKRGGKKHGSCGLGIHETMIRKAFHWHDFIGTTGEELIADLPVYEKLKVYRDTEIKERISELNIELTPEWEYILMSEPMLDNFIFACEYMRKHSVSFDGDYHMFANMFDVIFEGAQGLHLDEDSIFFPHVTHSKTGLDNVLNIVQRMGIEALNVSYMTRCYTTRHGAGELPHELAMQPYDGIVDETNIYNVHQENLRFSYLNCDLLALGIQRDFYSPDVPITAGIVVTCLDQIGNEKPKVILADKEVVTKSIEDLLQIVHRFIPDVPVTHVSYGPTKDDIKEYHAVS